MVNIYWYTQQDIDIMIYRFKIMPGQRGCGWNLWLSLKRWQQYIALSVPTGSRFHWHLRAMLFFFPSGDWLHYKELHTSSSMQNFVANCLHFWNDFEHIEMKSHDFWRCFVCNTAVPMSQSFVQHLRTSAHFTALCSSVRGQSKLALQVEKVHDRSLGPLSFTCKCFRFCFSRPDL